MSDEELVLRVIAGEKAVQEMLAAGAPLAQADAGWPLIRLIDALAARGDYAGVSIRRSGLLLRLERRRRFRN